MNIVILGGTGYIGTFLNNICIEKDYNVKAIGRETDKSFNIGEKVDESIFDGVDIVFYLAWEFNTLLKNYREANINSYMEVVNICKKKSIKIYFFSTIYSSLESKSQYNRVKAECENLSIINNFPVIRLGAVIINGLDSKGNSFYDKIYKFVLRYKIFPLILPNKKVFKITSQQHLIDFIYNMKNYENKINILTSNNNLTLFEIINSKNKIYFKIPIPWQLLYLILKTIEIFVNKFNFRSDSLLSIWGSELNNRNK